MYMQIYHRVPETLLKKRKKNEELRAAQIATAVAKKKDKREKKASAFRSAEKFVKSFRAVSNVVVECLYVYMHV